MIVEKNNWGLQDVLRLAMFFGGRVGAVSRLCLRADVRVTGFEK